MLERQKKLIDILEKKGLMDKELKFGCYIETHHKGKNFGGGEYDSMCLGQICSYEFEEEEGNEYEDDSLEVIYECGYSQSLYTTKGLSKIIGQYHLGSILTLLTKMYVNTAHSNEFSLVESLRTGKQMRIDFRKPPMERTEQQNKELVLFLENI